MALEGTIHQVHTENGREYHAFRRGTYMLPCDEAEKDRLDLFHTLFKTARGNRLISSRLTGDPESLRILDIGCGTGIWAIDVADEHPKSEVVGWDLSLIQPPAIPTNLSFRQRDFETPWHGVGEDAWDLIHMRLLAGSVGSWNELFYKAFRHLKPGYGCIESVEIDFEPKCDDNSLPPDSALCIWWKELSDATDRAYKPLALPQTGPLLQSIGFIDVRHQVIRIPCNPAWPSLPNEMELGRWFTLGLGLALQGMTLAPLYRVKNWSREQVDELVAAVLEQSTTSKCHAYFEMHVWTARKPGPIQDHRGDVHQSYHNGGRPSYHNSSHRTFV